MMLHEHDIWSDSWPLKPLKLPEQKKEQRTAADQFFPSWFWFRFATVKDFLFSWWQFLSPKIIALVVCFQISGRELFKRLSPNSLRCYIIISRKAFVFTSRFNHGTNQMNCRGLKMYSYSVPKCGEIQNDDKHLTVLSTRLYYRQEDQKSTWSA